MPDIDKADRREAAHRRARYGQRSQGKWWLAVARSQTKRADTLEQRAAAREAQRAKQNQKRGRHSERNATGE